MPRRRLPLRRPASPLIRYSFLTLTLLALLTAQTGPAIICAAITALTWKGHRT
jgi:hypothetical protein